MKKGYVLKLLSCVLLLACLLSMSVCVNAQTQEPEEASPAAVEPRMEQTTWVFRNINGVLYRRLWSNTYGVWLTGWIKA